MPGSQYENSLLSLVSALKNGLDPNTALGLYSNLQQQQAQNVAARQQSLQSLAQAAAGGATYDQARILAQLGGGIGPRVEQALQTLYPQPNLPIPSELQPGNNPNWQAGTPMPQNVAQQVVGQAQSPLAPEPNPVDQLQQIQAQEAIVGISRWQSLASEVQAVKQAKPNATPQQVLAAAAADYPDLVAADPGKFQSVIESIIGINPVMTAQQAALIGQMGR